MCERAGHEERYPKNINKIGRKTKKLHSLGSQVDR